MSNSSEAPRPKSSVMIFTLLVVAVLAILVGGSTLIPVYDCEACGGTGISQGLEVSDYHGNHNCEICGGTLRVSLWSGKFGAHAQFMSHFR